MQEIKIIEIAKTDLLFSSFLSEEIANEITCSSNDIILDFSKCIIDYTATSIIIDKVLQYLLEKEGNKNLTIKVDFATTESLLLTLLFVGSRVLNISDMYRIEYDKILKALEEKLLPQKINLTIITPKYQIKI